MMEKGMGSKEQLKIITQFLSRFGKFFNEMAQLCILQLAEEDDTKYKNRMILNQNTINTLGKARQQEKQRQNKESEKKDITLQMIKNLKPKHPVSSFFFFYKERSQKISKEQGEMLGSQLAKIIGNIWQTMSEAEKEPFEVKAKQSRDYYEKEMLEYTSKYSKEIAWYKRYKKEQKEEKKRKIESLMKPREVQMKQQENVKGQQKEEDHYSQLSDSILSLSQDMSDSLGIKSKDSSSSLRQVTSQHQNSKPRKAINQNIQTELISNSNAKVNIQNLSKSNSFDEDIILTIGDDFRKEIEDKLTPQSKISKPKGPVSSFFIFYQLQGKRIASENGISLGPQAIKLASAKWNQIPASQKQKYKIQSEKTREKYRQDMADLKQQYGDSVFDTKKVKKSRKGNKKTKKLIQ